MSLLPKLVVDNDNLEEFGRDSVREKRLSGLMSPGSELLTESSSLRIQNLFADEVINKEQRDILKAQIDVKNTEVMRDLCLLPDENLCTLADDLLFQANSFTNIDGAGGSTLYALRTTGDSLESPKRPLSLRKQLSMKRNSWLGSLQEARNIPLSIDDAPAPQPVQEIVPTTQNTSRTKSSTKIFTAEDYFHRLKDKNRRMERESFDKNRMKRATDIPAVFVVKKNKPKVESSRPSLPLQKTSSYDRSIIDLKNSTITKTDSKELPKKGGFFAGLTNLFKKKLPKKENLVVNSANDQFEFHVVPEDEKRVEGIQHGSEVANNTQIQGNSKINNSSQTEPNPEYSVVETERLSPTNNTFPESPNAPLWEIFSKSPSFSSFECSNVSSEIHHLNELSNQNVAATEMGEVPKLSDEVSPTPPPDDDDKSMEVWECYQTNDETNSDAMKERKITWLFSNGYQANQASAFENHESDSNEGEGKKPFLPLLFGNIVNTTTTSKKEYSKYYMKPLEIRTSSLKKSKPSSTAKVVKHVSFSSIEIRFYTYTIGQGIPSDGGPSLGLNWNNDPALTLHTDVETFEDFRGGIVPDDADDDEEWDDNWRIPREYFLDAGGRLTPEVRINHLKSAGHRRCSIDLSSYLCRQDMASRVKNSRSRAARLLIDGTDPDEVVVLQKEWEARQVVEPYLMQWIQSRKLRKS